MSASLPFGVTVCGIDELHGHCVTGATHVLSILDPGFKVPEAFSAYDTHERVELRFHDVIEPGADVVAPAPEDVRRILALGASMRQAPAGAAHLLVHCHAGISRSTASMALILAQAMPGESATAILALVHEIREQAWPNLRLIEIGDAMLGRNGALVAATHALYRLQLERSPQTAALRESDGRGREITAARAAVP